MKNFTQLLLLSLVALPMFTTFAEVSEPTDVKAAIESLRAEKDEIRSQVEDGTITKEEARALWSTKMEELKILKDAQFDQKMAKLQTKFAERAAENPAEADAINDRLARITSFFTNQRASSKALNEEMKAKIENGEITREEAREMRKVSRAEQKGERKEAREAQKSERKEGIKGGREAFQNDLRDKVENGEMTADEAKSIVESHRAEKKADHEARMETMKDSNPERYEKAIERQTERAERRGEQTRKRGALFQR
jgi:hypothetical protein